MKKILITDDDIHIGNMTEEVLRKAGYDVIRAYSGTEALFALSSEKPDLVLLDLMLPGLSGEELLPKIKDIPVIVVSAKAGIDDKVSLLLGGAADYITKPFETRELVARIEVALRRSAFSSDANMHFRDLALNTDIREAYVNGQKIKLTRTEYAILKILIQNPEQVIAKSRLLDMISEDTPDCTESSLKIHISNLRKKLREAAGEEYIESVWGIGFKMRQVTPDG